MTAARGEKFGGNSIELAPNTPGDFADYEHIKMSGEGKNED